MWGAIVMSAESALITAVYAFVVAVIGYVIALFVERLVGKAYRYLGIKDYMESTGYERAVLGIEFETIVKEIAKWWVFLIVLAQVMEILNLYTAANLFETLLDGYTSLALAIIYFSAGAIVAHYVGERLREAKVYGGNLTVGIVKVVILYIAAITALQLIGYSGVYFLNRLVELFVTALVIAFGLSVGIAFGLGGQETAKKILEKHRAEIEKLFK